MYVPPAFREEDPRTLHAMMRQVRLCNLVTSTAEGLISSPLPLFLDEEEGEQGTLYGHLSRGNPQWKMPVSGEALAIFMGPDAYVTPSWYASKQEHGMVVPTWNYVAIHAYGPVEFFEDANRLLQVVSRLTDLNEQARSEPWSVTDAPAEFLRGQLKGIVGVRMPISRLEGKYKMSQNRSAKDRAGVAAGLAASDRPVDRAVAALIPVDKE